jgi:rod shape-determining protein MreD
MIRKMRFSLCVAVLFLLQATLVHRFTHRFLRPDLLYLAVIFLGLEARFSGAVGGAFAVGVLRDLGSCGRLGAGPLLLVPATALLVAARDRLVRESVLTDVALTFAFVLGCGLVSALGTWIASRGGALEELLWRAFGQAAFTTVLSPLLFAAFLKAGLVEGTSVSLDAA